MDNYIDDCRDTIFKVQDLLKENEEWESRYLKYAEKINANIETIIKNKRKFNEWAPLYLYMNVTEAKSRMIFSLRYLGQDVARLNVGKDKVTISTKDFDEQNKRDFKCNIRLEKDKIEWRSKEARAFRKHFSGCPQRTNISGKKNEEHRIESLLLTEFSKKRSTSKLLCNIQPIKLADIARFQMPTPLTASDPREVKYSGLNGGGIDIISRIGTGRSTKICIMEIKDENVSKEPPTKVIKQSLAYATFIRELLRSKCGNEWWKLFGFKGKFPYKLALYVACVMPSVSNNEISFAGETIKLNDNDSFYLHYIYFREDKNKIVNIETSLGKNSTKNHI